MRPSFLQPLPLSFSALNKHGAAKESTGCIGLQNDTDRQNLFSRCFFAADHLNLRLRSPRVLVCIRGMPRSNWSNRIVDRLVIVELKERRAATIAASITVVQSRRSARRRVLECKQNSSEIIIGARVSKTLRKAQADIEASYRARQCILGHWRRRY